MVFQPNVCQIVRIIMFGTKNSCIPKNKRRSVSGPNIATRMSLMIPELEYKVVALSSDETVASGKLTVAANDAVQADVVDMCNDNFEIYLISWETEDGQKGVNHYVCGRIPYDINRYRELMEKTGILKLEGF